RTTALEREEEPAKIFKTRERQHASRNRITTLRIGDSVVSEKKAIEEPFGNSYTDLFSEKKRAQPPRRFGEPLQGLSDPIKRQINRPIATSEVEDAIKNLAPQSTDCRATERALCSEDMLQALCNDLGACATSGGSAFHGPVFSWEVLHGGDDILSSTSFTIWDQVHEGVALQAHERRALRPRGQACTSISTES
ncbi:hypothetical protein HPB47_007284, partial [Ixodes persulcatus]